MKIACVLVLVLTYEYANAYVVERLTMPTVVLDSGCGCSPPIDYGCTTIMSPCGCRSSCGYSISDMPLIGYDTSICQRSFSPILDMGVAYPLMDSGCLFPDVYEISYPRSGCGCGCGCGLVVSDCVPVPPLPPVIGCPKYLRQITLPPPFL